MIKIKTEAVELIGLRYDKEKRKYRALFEVLNMKIEEWNKISKNKHFLSQRNFEMAVCKAGSKTAMLIGVWLTEEEFNKYDSLIEIAKDKEDEIPRRIHPQILRQELDMRMLEQNMGYYLIHTCESKKELKKLELSEINQIFVLF